MKRTVHVLAIMAIPYYSNSAADVTLGGGSWSATMQGTIGEGETPVTIKELGIPDKAQSYFYLDISHSVPALPNIRLSQLNFQNKATTTAPRDFTINDTSYTQNSTVASDIDLSYTEASLYYPFIDDWFSLDIGFSARAFNGLTHIERTSTPSEDDGSGDDSGGDDGSGDDGAGDDSGGDTQDPNTDEPSTPESTEELFELTTTVPLVFIQSGLDFPFSNWMLNATYNTMGYSGSNYSDLDIKLSYASRDFALNYGIDIGFREIKLDLKDANDLTSDINIEGFYFSLNLIL